MREEVSLEVPSECNRDLGFRRLDRARKGTGSESAATPETDGADAL